MHPALLITKATGTLDDTSTSSDGGREDGWDELTHVYPSPNPSPSWFWDRLCIRDSLLNVANMEYHARIERVRESDAGHAEYEIEVRCGAQRWRVSRRYSILRRLHTDLAAALPLPHFPAPKLLLHCSCMPHTLDWALEARKADLQRFLDGVTHTIAQTPGPDLPEPWIRFLGDPADPAPMNANGEPVATRWPPTPAPSHPDTSHAHCHPDTYPFLPIPSHATPRVPLSRRAESLQRRLRWILTASTANPITSPRRRIPTLTDWST